MEPSTPLMLEQLCAGHPGERTVHTIQHCDIRGHTLHLGGEQGAERSAKLGELALAVLQQLRAARDQVSPDQPLRRRSGTVQLVRRMPSGQGDATIGQGKADVRVSTRCGWERDRRHTLTASLAFIREDAVGVYHATPPALP